MPTSISIIFIYLPKIWNLQILFQFRYRNLKFFLHIFFRTQILLIYTCCMSKSELNFYFCKLMFFTAVILTRVNFIFAEVQKQNQITSTSAVVPLLGTCSNNFSKALKFVSHVRRNTVSWATPSMSVLFSQANRKSFEIMWFYHDLIV